MNYPRAITICVIALFSFYHSIVFANPNTSKKLADELKNLTGTFTGAWTIYGVNEAKEVVKKGKWSDILRAKNPVIKKNRAYVTVSEQIVFENKTLPYKKQWLEGFFVKGDGTLGDRFYHFQETHRMFKLAKNSWAYYADADPRELILLGFSNVISARHLIVKNVTRDKDKEIHSISRLTTVSWKNQDNIEQMEYLSFKGEYQRESSSHLEEIIDPESLIERANDGDTVYIPNGQYILKKSLVIKGREDLTINFGVGTQILVEDPNAHVLIVDNCKNIKIKNAYLRHLVPLKEYECHGSVLRIQNSEDIKVINSELNGCGAIGVDAENTKKLLVENCLIHENSFTGIYLVKCNEVFIRSNIIEKNGNFLQTYQVGSMEFCNNIVRNNGGYWRAVDTTPGLKK